MINWKAVQAYGCLKPDFHIPGDVNVSQMAGGSRHANLHKDGILYKSSRGGLRKSTGKAKIRIGPWRKDKIFSPVLIRV